MYIELHLLTIDCYFVSVAIGNEPDSATVYSAITGMYIMYMYSIILCTCIVLYYVHV